MDNLQKKEPHAPMPASILTEGQIPANVARLVEEISHLNMLEITLLTEAIATKLGIPSPQESMAKFMAGGFVNMGAVVASGGQVGGQGPAPTSTAPAPDQAAAGEKKKEEKKAEEKKDIFTIKLVKVADDAKFKVLKEVRALRPGMTVSDSKKFVENLPSILKEAVPKEEAQKWAEKIKEAGGEVKLE